MPTPSPPGALHGRARSGYVAHMLDHLSVPARDYAKSKAFYEKALAPLGYKLQMEFGPHGGFGEREGAPEFWLNGEATAHAPVHVAFRAPDRAAVDAFYAAAIGAGAQDNGGPGIRKDYHPTYYAAFVLDPDGHNIEAVCHRPPIAPASE